MQMWTTARRRVLAVAGGLALLAVGVGAGAAAVSSPGVTETGDTSQMQEATTTGTAETSTAPGAQRPATTTSETVSSAPAAPTTAATVDTVTEPAPQPEPVPESTQDPSIGTFAPNGDYVPAGPPSRPGQPPMGEVAPEAPVERLPGEAGYVPPGGGEPPVLDIDG